MSNSESHPDVLIRRLNTEDPRDFAALMPVSREVMCEQNPGFPTPGESRLRLWTTSTPHRLVAVLAAFAAPDAPYADGIAILDWEVEANEDLVSIALWVAPGARRRGIGTALLAAARRFTADLGRSRLAGNASSAAPATEFAAKFGAKAVESVQRSVLDLTAVSRDRMVELAEPSAKNAQYTLVRWVDRCPDEYVDSFCTADDAMNDAPKDDFEQGHAALTHERLRGREDQIIKAGLHRMVLAAVDPQGTVAGFTMIVGAADEPEALDIWDTGVTRAHRGHGLGLRLKAAQTAWMLEDRPSARIVHTFNNAGNEHMLAVNRALGYEAREVWTWFQLDVTPQERTK